MEVWKMIFLFKWGFLGSMLIFGGVLCLVGGWTNPSEKYELTDDNSHK